MAFNRGVDDDDLLTPEQAARRLGISAGTLRHWVSQKRIEYVRMGRLTRFRPDQLQRHIDRSVQREIKR
jgi:excisionase family DNA binding protein